MGKCDFCSDPQPAWIYPAESFTVNKVNWGSEDDWAACEECSQLIEDGKHETVVKERMLATAAVGVNGALWNLFNKEERREVEVETRRLYDKFRRARRGPRRPLRIL